METITFKKLPVINPINDPRAALSACWCCLPAYFSPRYAHKNGPPINHNRPKGQITIPNIGKTITATISPILLPRTPRFVPPNFLVHRDGTT